MKQLKERVFDCAATEYDPTTKRVFTSLQIAQGSRITVGYQRGIVDSEGNFLPSRPYTVTIVGKRAETFIENLTDSLNPILETLQVEVDKPGKTLAQEREEEFLQGQADKVIEEVDDTSVVFDEVTPKEEEDVIYPNP